jgi:hypothetical protein
MKHTFVKAKLLMHQSHGQKSKAELWELLKGQVAEILQETFASCQKDEKLYIFRIEHYRKLMPHLLMPHFQPTTMAFPNTRASEAREVGEEMEINS